MEQKIILHFFHRIALHVFLNCHGKIYHFWKYFCSQQSKEILWNTIKQTKFGFETVVYYISWTCSKKPPEQLNIAKNQGHSQEKDWLENSYVYWIYENCSFFPYDKQTVPQCTWWLHTEALYSTRDIFISYANGIISELGTFDF